MNYNSRTTNPYEPSAVQPEKGERVHSDNGTSDNLIRGILYGVAFACIGALGASIFLIAFDVLLHRGNGDLSFARYLNGSLWYEAVPVFVVIPMATCLAAIANYAPRKRAGYIRTLAGLLVVGVPAAMFLGACGLSPTRYRGTIHPPIYLSEVLMFFIPFGTVCCVLLTLRWTPRTSALADVDRDRTP